MVTIIFTDRIEKDGFRQNENLDAYFRAGFVGLSTDTKPVNALSEDLPFYLVGNGSIFFELDTGNVSYFDGDSRAWV